MAWTIGQKVVVVSHRGRETTVDDGEIVKVGRKWLTVKCRGWSEDRFDLDGRHEHPHGGKPHLWPDRTAYDAEMVRRAAWRMFSDAVRENTHPPKHITNDQLAEMLAIVRPTPPSQEDGQ